MKKSLALIFAVLMGFLSVGMGTVDASADADAGQENSKFVFRNGITWGMSEEEVKAHEDIEFESKIHKSGIWTALVGTEAVKVSNHTGYPLFIFISGKLTVAGYVIVNLQSNSFDTLRIAYGKKYGAEVEADPEGLSAIMEMWGSGFTLEEIRKMDLCRWQATGNTEVWLANASAEGQGAIIIFYDSTEYIHEQKEDTIDLTGI